MIYIADYRYDEGLRIRKDGIAPCLNTVGGVSDTYSLGNRGERA